MSARGESFAVGPSTVVSRAPCLRLPRTFRDMWSAAPVATISNARTAVSTGVKPPVSRSVRSQSWIRFSYGFFGVDPVEMSFCDPDFQLAGIEGDCDDTGITQLAVEIRGQRDKRGFGNRVHAGEWPAV